MKPSIGRNVHFRSSEGWCHANIVYVHDDEQHINLVVWDHDGIPFTAHGVVEGERIGDWRWPPRV